MNLKDNTERIRKNSFSGCAVRTGTIYTHKGIRLHNTHRNKVIIYTPLFSRILVLKSNFHLKRDCTFQDASHQQIGV